jgi:predicted outer membrane repeat protein
LHRKWIFSILLLILSVFVLATQMYQPALAMEPENNAQTQNDIESAGAQEENAGDGAAGEENTDTDPAEEGSAADDITEDPAAGLLGSPLMGSRGFDPYVITNNADPGERYVLADFSELDAKIRELAALGNAYTITLNQELAVTGDSSLVFPGPSGWTVEGNGNTVKKEETAPVNLNRVITIGESGYPSSVTLKNVVIEGENRYRTCRIIDGSTLTMDSGAIIQNGYSASGATTGGIHMNKNTALYMRPGSRISGNVSETTSYYGGAIRMLSNCVVDIDGAVISGNRVSNAGGAIHAPHEAQSINIQNTTFSANVSGEFGGAIHSAVLTTIENSRFENNIAETGLGGAILMASAQVSDNERLFVKNSTFSGNTAVGGGAISSNLETSIESVLFEGNVASSYGGAINLTARSTASLTVASSTFTNNKAGRGGAIFTQRGTIIKNDTSFRKNEAQVEGGAIYTDSLSYADPADSSKYANLNIDNTTSFEKNTASYPYEPPGNYANFTALLFSRTSFTGQVNPYTGGVVLVNDSLLNNYDINYKNTAESTLCSISYQFEDADAGSLPQEVLDLLLAGSEAGIGSIVIPAAPAANTVVLANNGGMWTFTGWNTTQTNIPEEGVVFTGTWTYTAPVSETPPPDPGQIPKTGDAGMVYPFAVLMVFASVVLLMMRRKAVSK